MSNTYRKTAVSTLAVLAPIVALAGYFLTTGNTPDPMPSHWNLHGHVDGTTGATALVVGFVAAAALVALAEVIMVWLVKESGQLLPAVLCYGGWLLGLGYLQIALVARGSADASTVRLPWYCVVLMVVAPAVPAVLTWRLRPLAAHRSVRLAASPMTFGANERVVWIGQAHSKPLAGFGLLGLVAAAVLALVTPGVAVVVGVVGLALAGVSSLGVRVDDGGLHTLWGPVGWPRTVVPLDDIVSVGAEEIHPLRWGGWGYRIGRHGVAAVVRRGPGLVIERRDHPTYAVTVDGAAQAADVLNALLSRHNVGSSGQAHPSSA